MDTIKYWITVLNATQLLEKSLTQLPSNAENVLMEPSTTLLSNHVNVNVTHQGKSTLQLKNANALKEKSSWTMSVYVLKISHFGTEKLVLPVHQEQHLSQKISNVIIVPKDSLPIQLPITAHQLFEIGFDFYFMYFH